MATAKATPCMRAPHQVVCATFTPSARTQAVYPANTHPSPAGGTWRRSRAVVLTQGGTRPPGDVWPSLEAFFHSWSWQLKGGVTVGI